MVELVFSLCAFLPLCFYLPLPLRSPSPVCPYSQCLFTHLFLPLVRPTVHSFKNEFPYISPPPSLSLHLLGVTVCSLPLSTAFPPSLLVSFLHPPFTRFSPSLSTTPRLVLFCRNDKAAGGRVCGHSQGNWLFTAQFCVESSPVYSGLAASLPQPHNVVSCSEGLPLPTQVDFQRSKLLV